MLTVLDLFSGIGGFTLGLEQTGGFKTVAFCEQDKACQKVLVELGKENDPLLKIAMKLEKIALEDEYFIERNLYPNVDFYSGIILKAVGIPVNLFTVIFATGRTPGWVAHWHEMISNPFKIGRPRQLYTGAQQRDYPG